MLTFVHYVGAQMRGPVLALYAAAHGATPSGVGLIMGAHMMAAAVGSMPFGRASDVCGRRPFMIGGMALSVVTSLLLPIVEDWRVLALVYGVAGFGVAAFTPSALSVVGDAAPTDKIGHAYAWYSTAHYGAIAVGPFLGGIVTEPWGYRATFILSAAVIAAALVIGECMLARETARTTARSSGTFAEIERNTGVWAGWIISLSGLVVQGVVFPFLPLVASERGLGPAAIGLVFLVLGLANTAARLPAGWLIDRTRRTAVYAVGGVLAASAATALLPHASDLWATLALVALFGGASGVAFVAISVALTAATVPSVRGLVMGGYSTSLYLGFALGSVALGPVATRHGYPAAFGVGAAIAAMGTLIAGLLWARHARMSQAPARPRAPGR